MKYSNNIFLKLRRVSLMMAIMSFCSLTSVQATHIVGGELRYEWDEQGRFHLFLTFFRECATANDPAFFDVPAYVGVFDGDNNLIRTMGRNGVFVLEDEEPQFYTEQFSNPCRVSINDVCYEQIDFCVVIDDLPVREGGYQFVYQRCCRNDALTNVVDPLNAGMTLVTNVSEEAIRTRNNSAEMQAWPPVFACINEEMVRDMSATDADGDEIRYSLYNPKTGASIDVSRPIPPSNPPYEEVALAGGYSTDNFMGGVPFTIDQNTGVISAVPNTIGNFLVGVQVEEYRDGELFNVTTREFQIEVGECTNAIQADFSYEQLCGGPVQFTNQTEDTIANAFLWHFDYDGDRNITSTEENPLYMYDQIGTYTVALIAIDTINNCFDTVMKEVVIDELDTLDIIAHPSACVPLLYDFEFLSGRQVDHDNIRWVFGDGTDTSMNSYHLYAEAGTYIVTAIVEDTLCTISLRKEIEIQGFDVEFPDTLMFCIGDSTLIEHDNSRDCQYEWFAAENFVDAFEVEPIFIGSEEGYIYVHITDSIVEEIFFRDSIYVLLGDEIDFDAAARDFCPGEEFELNPEGNPDYSYVWMPGELFDDSTAVNPAVLLFEDTVITVQITDPATGCVSEFEVPLNTLDPGYDIDFDTDYDCEGTGLSLVNQSGGGDSIEWLYEEQVIGVEDSIFFDFGAEGIYEVVLRVYADNGCVYDVTKMINVSPLDAMLEDTIFACEMGDVVALNPNGNDGLIYEWSGPGITDENASESNPEVEIIANSLFTVTVRDPNNDSCVIMDEVFVDLLEDDFDLIAEDSTGVCEDLGGVLSVQNADIFESIVWTDPNGNTLPGEEVTIDPALGVSGFYLVMASDGRCVFTDSVYIDVREYRLNTMPGGPYCEGDTVVVNVNDLSGNEITEVIWEDSEEIEIVDIVFNQATVVVNREGTIGGTLIYADGCELPFESEVFEVGMLEGGEITAEHDTIVDGMSTTITVSGLPDGVTIDWQPVEYISDGIGTDQITVAPPRTMTFTASITDSNGCTVTLSKTIFVLDAMCTDESYFIPNVFTPNGDNINDTWCVKSRLIDNTNIGDIEEVFLIVYDRWGEEVYRGQGVPEETCWDGRFDGEQLAPDVYAYYARMTCIGGMTIEKRGNLTLLR